MCTALLLLTLAAADLGCRREAASTSDGAGKTATKAGPPRASRPPDTADGTLRRTRTHLLDLAATCDLEHGGIVLDLGGNDASGVHGFQLRSQPPLPILVHEGTKYARLNVRQTALTVWLSEPAEELEFSAQVLSAGSDLLAAYLDGVRLGGVKLPKDGPAVVRIRARKMAASSGPHELMVSLSSKRGAGMGADVSWVRLGPPAPADAGAKTDVPPGRSEVFSEMRAGDEQRRAIVLRHGGALRCPLWVPAAAHLLTAVGVWGSGSALAEVVVRTADGGRQLQRQVRLEPEVAAKGWFPLDLDLSAYAGQAVELELRASSAPEGARLGFADPALVGAVLPVAPAVQARRAVVVILSGLGRRHAPPTAADHGLPVLGAAANTGTFYPGYRAPTGSVVGVVASLLTGVEPWQHGLSRDASQLSAAVPTLAEALAAAGGDAAFFTGVPLSFEGFGFARGFERFSSISPAEDRAATAPLDEMQTWLERHRDRTTPLLAMVHLRGAHPPFDVDRETARTLEPAEYGGDLDARRAAIQLGEIGSRQPERRRLMPEEDWVRLYALERRALLAQDARMAALFSWLSATFSDDKTLLVVMGDIASGERPTIPFSADPPLDEDTLQTVLLIRHPGGGQAGASVAGTFSTTDVSATIAAALGVDRSRFSGTALDLGNRASTVLAEARTQIAYRDGTYAARLGAFLLMGQDGHRPRLCHLQLDPSCVEDRFAREPLALRALWTNTWRALRPALDLSKPAQARAAEQRLEDALTVWGIPR